ncbi:MAG: hypothetical protein Q4G60_15230 [bacterium]|nr:hypothetical protein [bacterium]
MFDKFGEIGSAAEINELAKNMLKEGDIAGIEVLAAENGIDQYDTEDFIAGEVDFLCNDLMAAIGKLDVEHNDLQPKEIIQDWEDYIRIQCQEKKEMAEAVRKKGKSLKGCIGKLLQWSFKNSYEVDKDIVKAAGVSANMVKMGIPGMKQAKKLIMEYYMGSK